MTDQSAGDVDVAKQRSPAYPYIDLELALERVAKLYEKVRDTAQPREVMASAYGKPATSSATIQTFATLSQYGLLEPVLSGGLRKLRVTALGRSITHPNAPDDVVSGGRKTAALNPAIFKELWEVYGSTEGLHDRVVLYYLTQDRAGVHGSVFTEKAAHEVLRVYRATLAFAGLSDADKNGLGSARESEPEADTDAGGDFAGSVRLAREDEVPPPPSPLASRKQGIEMAQNERELQSGMLSKGAAYRVIVSGQIGVREIERLIKKLEMDKEILADEDADDIEDLLA